YAAHPGEAGGVPERCRSGAGRGRGRVARAGLEPRRAEVRLHEVLPRAVGDLGAQGGVALLQADAVLLLGEGLADELELALVRRLAGVAGEDRVVGGQ